MDNRLYIYADGSCLATGAGPSGYGTIVKDGDLEQELGEGFELSTNNRMELLGVIVALESLEVGRNITVTSDSMYVKDGIEKYIHAWRKRGWKKADGYDVLNKDLWIRLWEASRPHIIKWEWVKGHTGHPENERCDTIAKGHASNPTLKDEGYLTYNLNLEKNPSPNKGNFNKWRNWKK